VLRYDNRVHKDTSSLVFIKYLTTVFDNVGQSVLLISVEPEQRYKVLLVNKTFGKTSGFPRDINGRYLDELLPPGVLDQVARHYRRVIETKQNIAYSEWMETPKGPRRFDVKIIPILNSVGECVQLVSMSYDATKDYMAKRERTAAIALNRYMVGDKRAFVVTDGQFIILRQVNLPPSMSHWKIGHRISEYLTAADQADFERLAETPDDTHRASFLPSRDASTLTYTLFYDGGLKRFIMNIALR